jgi:hypothetical protein
MTSTLTLMTQHPGRWFTIRLAELGSLVANDECEAIYQIAKERSFAILASWQRRVDSDQGQPPEWLHLLLAAGAAVMRDRPALLQTRSITGGFK